MAAGFKFAAWWAAAVLGVGLSLWLLAPVLAPFAIAAVLAYVLNPSVNLVCRAGGRLVGRWFAVLLVESAFIVLTTGLALMQRRSELMAAAGGGAMTAVIGFERSQLEELVAATEGVVIANDNSSAQVVLSGTPEAVASVSGQLTCKRAIPLAVSGAFHSPFMAEAAKAFATSLASVPFAKATIPVLSNTDPTPETDGDVLKGRLVDQMTSGVRWRETMDQLSACGIDTAVEIGPGNVLSGLIKRGCNGITTVQVAAAADLAL